MGDIPVSVLITTKNEERNIARCLKALSAFDEVIVIDSSSEDRTVEIAKQAGVQVLAYAWDGTYPKKRGWCLENIPIKHDWVFWVDADEVVTQALANEVRSCIATKSQYDGFFVRGQYVWHGSLLKYGLKNNKIALFNCQKMLFPVVDDLDIDGMGEIEGHYQPVAKQGGVVHICQLKATLLHYAYGDRALWEKRHARYAVWEAEMIRRNAFPADPVFWREALKRALRRFPLRSWVMFFYSYVVKGGFLDGRPGFDFALSRKHYCDMIRDELKR